MQFFIHAIEDAFWWPEVLSYIQSLLNNTFFSTIGKTPNKITYKFSFRRPLNLFLAITLPGIYVAYIGAADIIFFAFTNHKKHYNRNYLSIFMKVRDRVMLKLYKSYLIFSSIMIIKKLTQQYIGLFQIIQKVDWLTFKLKVLNHQKIRPIFSIAQFEPISNLSEDLFWRLCLQQSFWVFVKDDTDKYKLFEIDCFFNKRIVKKSRGLAIKCLI